MIYCHTFDSFQIHVLRWHSWWGCKAFASRSNDTFSTADDGYFCVSYLGITSQAVTGLLQILENAFKSSKLGSKQMVGLFHTVLTLNADQPFEGPCLCRVKQSFAKVLESFEVKLTNVLNLETAVHCNNSMKHLLYQSCVPSLATSLETATLLLNGRIFYWTGLPVDKICQVTICQGWFLPTLAGLCLSKANLWSHGTGRCVFFF